MRMSLIFKATRFSNGVFVRDIQDESKATWNPGVEVRSKCKSDKTTILKSGRQGRYLAQLKLKTKTINGNP